MSNQMITIKQAIDGFMLSITLSLALIVLNGRVYTQACWNVFGLTPETFDANLIDYAVVSPSTAIGSIFIAINVVGGLVYSMKQHPDIIGDSNPAIVEIIGMFFYLLLYSSSYY